MTAQESISIKEYFDTILEERDERLEQRFNSFQLAIDKAEKTTNERLAGMNEFRQSLTDSNRLMIPRLEYESNHDNLTSRVDEITKKVEKIENKKEGAGNMYVLIVGVLGILMGIASFILNIMGK